MWLSYFAYNIILAVLLQKVRLLHVHSQYLYYIYINYSMHVTIIYIYNVTTNT